MEIICPGSIVEFVDPTGGTTKAMVLTCTVGSYGPLWYRVAYWSGNVRNEADVHPKELVVTYETPKTYIGFAQPT